MEFDPNGCCDQAVRGSNEESKSIVGSSGMLDEAIDIEELDTTNEDELVLKENLGACKMGPKDGQVEQICKQQVENDLDDISFKVCYNPNGGPGNPPRVKVRRKSLR